VQTTKSFSLWIAMKVDQQPNTDHLASCPSCGAGPDRWHVVERPIEQAFRGESFAIHGRVFTCADCGFETMDPAEKDALVHATWAAYRQGHGLLTPEAIMRFRKELGLTQEAFADYLGVGVASVKRWEKGLVQDKAMDELIRSKMELHRCGAGRVPESDVYIHHVVELSKALTIHTSALSPWFPQWAGDFSDHRDSMVNAYHDTNSVGAQDAIISAA
jgi:putative zinc finger/helix-turn-helix YgiT family protein